MSAAAAERPVQTGTGFVLGGGGKWGAVQVGMLQALVERGIVPDVVLGCSIGAINGACFAADPTSAGVASLREFWERRAGAVIAEASWVQRVKTVVNRRPSLFGNEGLRRAIDEMLPGLGFEDLRVRFQCVAACIEESSEFWFSTGPLRDALLASSAVPGLLPPVAVGGRHFYDGGLVNSIPIDRAVAFECRTIYVLQVGRVEQPVVVPSRLYQAPLVAFEIARRHRFQTYRSGLPGDVRVHVLPSGHRLSMDDPRQLKWRNMGDAAELIRGAHAATAAYLDSPSGAADQRAS